MANISTNNGSSPEQNEAGPSTITLISLTFLMIVIVTALSGNLLVVLAFRVSAKLREVTNYFIVSLAIADILVAGISMPVWAAYLITGPQWILGEWLLKAWHYLDVLCGVASIMNLSFISVERCISISWPFSYDEKMTPIKAMISLAIIWAFAAFMAALRVITWSIPPLAYGLTVSVLCFFLPLVVMLVSYMKMYAAAHHQMKKMIISVHGKQKKFVLAKELKAAKTVAVVIGAFFVCWCPFFVLNLMHALCESCRPISTTSVMVAKWMHYVNSVLNPIIYARMNKDYRAAFKKLISYACSFLPCFERPEFRGDSFRRSRSAREGSSIRSTRTYTYQDEMNYNSCNNEQETCYV